MDYTQATDSCVIRGRKQNCSDKRYKKTDENGKERGNWGYNNIRDMPRSKFRNSNISSTNNHAR